MYSVLSPVPDFQTAPNNCSKLTPSYSLPLPPYLSQPQIAEQEDSQPPSSNKPDAQDHQIMPQSLPNGHSISVNSTGTPIYRYSPTMANCPKCHEYVFTVVRLHPGSLTWLLSALLCLLGFCCCCCFIPFCIKDCQDAEHTCPNCKTVIGKYKRV